MFDFYQVADLLTPEEREIQKAARKFLEAECLPHIAEWWENAEFPTHLIRKFGEMGFLGTTIPTEYGGMGASSAAYGGICYGVERIGSRLWSFCSVASSLVMDPLWVYGC